MKVEIVNDINDVVTGIQWSCVAKDSAISDTITSVESGVMLTPPVDLNEYVTLTNITDTIVNDWIAVGMNKSLVEGKVLAVLNEQLVPKTTFIDVPDGINPLPPPEPVIPLRRNGILL